jgi:Ca-activated chloride channel family protein
MLKKSCFLVLVLIALVYGNGVAVVNGSTPEYLDLVSSYVTVDVENQVAVTTTKQTFINHIGGSTNFKYAFPMSEQASAISLRWFIHGEWHMASFSASPQDTSLTGGEGESPASSLKNYLGASPLYFNISEALENDSLVTVELTYVEFLPYEFGEVSYQYPNDYSLIQTANVDTQYFDFNVNSERHIDTLSLVDQSGAIINNDGNSATINLVKSSSAADQDYNVIYSLDLDELGLFGLSTFLADSLVPDSSSQGFFTFVAEPDPSETSSIINKIFTLIIDRSGSMSGTKMVQARNAASFIVEHLNVGDKFNIVDFSNDISSFQSQHIDFNPTNESAALTYISSLYASGTTNISGAFSEAIPQFSAASDSTANIIIFFTDGQATAGITSTDGILSHVRELVNTTETNMMIFTFGIGAYANEQLLSLLASENNGLAEFLGDNELEDKITNFYLKIQNPILLETEMSFSPDIISETYPHPLPNLYIGQQMIIAGRYSTPELLTINLSGNAFGHPVEYSYNLDLADSTVEKNQFLTKIWAKKKIEHLLVDYYGYSSSSSEAEEIKQEIVSLSMQFGVITPFTSFSETNDPTSIEDNGDLLDENTVSSYILLSNYPNPFNPSTAIKFRVSNDLSELVRINIYSISGKLIKVLFAQVNGIGDYEVYWDGKDMNGVEVSSGTYIYVLNTQDHILSGKMTLMK